jgi:hypothetical protein
LRQEIGNKPNKNKVLSFQCMSFVPAPQASAANAASANNTVVSSSAAASAAADGEADLLFKLRTFDVYWVEKSALMYRDGFDKVST